MTLPTTVVEVNNLIQDKYKVSNSIPPPVRSSIGEGILAIFDYFHEQMLIANYRELFNLAHTDSMSSDALKNVLKEVSIPFADDSSYVVLKLLVDNLAFIVKFRNTKKGLQKYVQCILADNNLSVTVTQSRSPRMMVPGTPGFCFPSWDMLKDDEHTPRLYIESMFIRTVYLVVSGGTVSGIMQNFIRDVAFTFVPMSESELMTLDIKFLE